MNKWLLSAKGSQMIKRKKKRQGNIPSKDNQQDEDVGSNFIMSG